MKTTVLLIAAALSIGGCSKKKQGGLSGQETSMIRAIDAGDSAEVERLVKGGYPVNNPITIESQQGIQHLTPLMLAARAGRQNVVGSLAALGADAKIKDEQGWTALFWALTAKNEDHGIGILQILLDAGLAVDSPSANGWTPLMVAAVSRNVDAVRFLLSRGANPNYQEATGGASPLSAAVRMGNLDAVKALVDGKADVNMKIPNRGYPLTLTTAGTVSSPSDREIAQYLLQNGANPNAVGEDGSTPLTSAIVENKTELAKILLQYHADPNLPERVQGRNPLMVCVLTRNYDMARALILMKADPFAQRRTDKATAFTMSQEQNDPQMFAVLRGQ